MVPRPESASVPLDGRPACRFVGVGRGRHDLWRVDSACAARVLNGHSMDNAVRPRCGLRVSEPDEQQPSTGVRTGGRASVKGEQMPGVSCGDSVHRTDRPSSCMRQDAVDLPIHSPHPDVRKGGGCGVCERFPLHRSSFSFFRICFLYIQTIFAVYYTNDYEKT